MHVQNNLMYCLEDAHFSKQKFFLQNVLHVSAYCDLPCAARSAHGVERFDLHVLPEHFCFKGITLPNIHKHNTSESGRTAKGRKHAFSGRVLWNDMSRCCSDSTGIAS